MHLAIKQQFMKIIKALTIVFFVSLIAVFIKTSTSKEKEIKISEGLTLQLSPNGGALHSLYPDAKRERYISIDTVFIDSLEAKRRRTSIFFAVGKTFQTPSGDYYYLIKKDRKGRVLNDSITHHSMLRSSKVMILTERVIIKDSLYYRSQK